MASAASALAFIWSGGLGDRSRPVFIAKNEAQTFADSAALYAAMELDGTGNEPYKGRCRGNQRQQMKFRNSGAGVILEGPSASNPVRNGVFPYSLITNVDATAPIVPVAETDPLGFVVGGLYDLKWPHKSVVHR